METDHLVQLARALRDLGVAKFTHGEFTVEFAPAAVGLPERPAMTQRDKVVAKRQDKEAEKERERERMELDLAGALS